MDTAVIVALIGVAGSLLVAVLNHHLQQRVHAQEIKLDRLYALSMSDDLFYQLKRLSTGAYGPYWIDPELRYGLGPELNYLKMLGYITFDRDSTVPDIREIPKGDNPDLSRYVRVTQQGLDFIALREAALKRDTQGRKP
ncbi:hypothetical protein TFLX_00688 [Thermoflexales bacterium]|jgi:hypothetical protein|nr:hypothetical protein TFLX_00688 [Thermoflexales bacterium]